MRNVVLKVKRVIKSPLIFATYGRRFTCEFFVSLELAKEWYQFYREGLDEERWAALLFIRDQ